MPPSLPADLIHVELASSALGAVDGDFPAVRIEKTPDLTGLRREPALGTNEAECNRLVFSHAAGIISRIR